MYAVTSKNINVVKTLVESGEILALHVDNKNNTAIDIAYILRQEEIALYLKSRFDYKEKKGLRALI